jgi:hypothetical protein
VTGRPPEWWHALPAMESWVPCGSGMHPVRWDDGALRLPAHPDAEGELVLAALGGEKAGCIELAEAWGRRADDLEVLAVGPRGAADKITISWEDVDDFRSGRHGGPHRVQGFAGRPVPRSGPMGAVSPPFPGTGASGGPAGGHVVGSAGPLRAAGSGGMVGRRTGPPLRSMPMRHPMQEEMERLRARHLDLLSLLALGPAFQMALSGTVAAAWSDGGARSAERSAHRPALEAALTGRLAPVAAVWLGIDPDRVDVRLHDGPGWGSLDLTGSGAGHELRASLPAGWLASVWACGLAVAGGHLVVAVQDAAWPEAAVLAVPEPGRAPVILGVRASEAEPAHWNVTSGATESAGTPSSDEAGET